MAPELLSPDTQLLSVIFPRSEGIRTTVLAQNCEVCTFIAHNVHVSESGESRGDMVVRLQISEEDSHLLKVAALQSIAAIALPELVLDVRHVGSATTGGGHKVQFAVTDFVPDCVTLETIWEDMPDDQKSEIMATLQDALFRLQSLDLSNDFVQQLLEDAGFTSNKTQPVGGPFFGYCADMRGLLQRLVQNHNPPSRSPSSFFIEDTETGGVTIRSKYQDVLDIHIPDVELHHLDRTAVLCHNDLELRNILVRPKTSPNGPVAYQIAAIIDWEMAGFFPFSYEYIYKDIELGSGNLSFSWYKLFKENTASFLPMAPLPKCHALLMQAIDLVHYSWERRRPGMVYVEFARRWAEREQIVRGRPIGTGWVKREGALLVRAMSEEKEALELEVLRDLGRI
jgi:thiamine kinase-like enzyme